MVSLDVNISRLVLNATLTYYSIVSKKKAHWLILNNHSSIKFYNTRPWNLTISLEQCFSIFSNQRQKFPTMKFPIPSSHLTTIFVVVISNNFFVKLVESGCQFQNPFWWDFFLIIDKMKLTINISFKIIICWHIRKIKYYLMQWGQCRSIYPVNSKCKPLQTCLL